MARTRSTAKAPPPKTAKKPPEKQPRWVVALCCVGIPVAVAAFIVGCIGVAVIMDEPNRTHWYSQTQFADLWRRMIQKNPFLMTVFVNGGMVSTLFLCTKLHEHYKAVKAERLLQKRLKPKKEE